MKLYFYRSAVKHYRNLFLEEGIDQCPIRIFYEKNRWGGGSGLDLELCLEGVGEEDVVFERDGLKIVISKTLVKLYRWIRVYAIKIQMQGDWYPTIDIKAS